MITSPTHNALLEQAQAVRSATNDFMLNYSVSRCYGAAALARALGLVSWEESDRFLALAENAFEHRGKELIEAARKDHLKRVCA
ncbi:hypothetical protein QMA71_04525 [Pseudomonas otitidis]|uniref:hypothetical protein n=1 Tax=Pseudomonadaceae TaxID=135621 RepID=UPI0024AE3305|nr:MULTISPECIES: hypothetical protein [Pseudomonas]MDI6524786.1 hypothetical protein [Pseudomonas otitidis]MDU9398360.1 hypothetical protein [Pseudomonas sp. zfem003]